MNPADIITALQQENLRLKREHLIEKIALVEACRGEITVHPEHAINSRGLVLHRRSNIDGSVTYKTKRAQP